jgi:dUTP pyrophosphatase
MSLFKKSKCERNMMPEKVGMFERVSFDQFYDDWVKLYGKDNVDRDTISAIYETIELPVRSTRRSAGYDFFCPFGFTLEKGANIVIPTGIRAYIDNDAYLALHPRSGMGFKYRVMLANTTGIIDADYWESDNEGHIMVKLCYTGIENPCTIVKKEDGDELTFEIKRPSKTSSNKPFTVKAGDRFVQGIFNTYGIVDDDKAEGIRNGGEGSTGR